MALSDDKLDSLLEQARAGDDEAVSSLVAGVRERVYRWALVMTGDSDDAEDITQQVSIAIHRKIGNFEERSRFTTWLYTIARNNVIELARKTARRRTIRLDDDAVPQTLAENVDEQITRFDNQRVAGLVRSFFTELPPRQRQLIELIDTEGYSAVEAAGMMGIEPETARVHLLRARRALRSRMLATHPELFA